MSKIGQLKTSESIEKAQREIKDWLSKVNVSGLNLIMQYDAKLNVAVIKFKKDLKDYEFRSNKQNNCRLNMWAIARVMEYKVRSSLMGIEDFEKSMSPYLAIENKSSFKAESIISTNEMNYVTLGISALSSNDEIQQRYKILMKSFHPDMAISSEAKKEFEKKTAEINMAYTEIKRERGL